jgi:hypothetical protein
MQVRLSKLSDSKHRLEIIRADGSRDAVELASRSFLLHDFLHFAVETRAGLAASFSGIQFRGELIISCAACGKQIRLSVHDGQTPKTKTLDMGSAYAWYWSINRWDVGSYSLVQQMLHPERRM